MDKITTIQYNNAISFEVMFTVPNKDIKQALSNNTMSFQDTQNMTLEEFQSFYGAQETQHSIRNKFLATQFSSDFFNKHSSNAFNI